jgi:hypothetical protein
MLQLLTKLLDGLVWGGVGLPGAQHVGVEVEEERGVKRVLVYGIEPVTRIRSDLEKRGQLS